MKLLQVLLLPFSLLYGLVLRARAWAYRTGLKKSFSVNAKVISIGNITVGGTGKTPMAAFLLGYLHQKGIRAGYLSRGYGRETQGYYLVDPESGDSRKFGDEALLIAHAFPAVPVAVCESRVEGARKMIADHQVQVLVLDDAFQHLRIRRDLDIIMVDGTRPPLSDFPFPAGRLREPRSAMKRAHAFVLSKHAADTDIAAIQKAFLRAFPETPFCRFDMAFQEWVPVDHSQQGLPSDNWKGQAVVGFSGLGNNAHFHRQLAETGADVREFVGYPDHHEYRPEDHSKILEAARRHTEINGKFGLVPILTTEKDYQRFKAHSWFTGDDRHPIYFVKAALRPVQGWESLKARIDRLID